MTDELDALIDKVMIEHELRLDRCETLPLKRRKSVRREANTSIISRAAGRITRARVPGDLAKRSHRLT